MSPCFFYKLLVCELIDIKIDDEKGTETRSQKHKQKIADEAYFIHYQQVHTNTRKIDGVRYVQGWCIYCDKHTTLI